MTRRERIAQLLQTALAPARLEVEDESHKHAGHAGAREGGETHYRIAIVAEAFVAKSRVARHRMVYDALAGEIAGGVHALALETRAPGEA